MFWTIFIGIGIGGLIYHHRTKCYYGFVLGKALAIQIFYTVAMRYDLLSGYKQICENHDMAQIIYMNSGARRCFMHVPFYRSLVPTMRNKKLILVKEGSKGIEYQDITHEPGLPYLFSAYDLGGKEIRVYESPTTDNWASNFITLNFEAIPSKPVTALAPQWSLVVTFSGKEPVEIKSLSNSMQVSF